MSRMGHRLILMCLLGLCQSPICVGGEVGVEDAVQLLQGGFKVVDEQRSENDGDTKANVEESFVEEGQEEAGTIKGQEESDIDESEEDEDKEDGEEDRDGDEEVKEGEDDEEENDEHREAGEITSNDLADAIEDIQESANDEEKDEADEDEDEEEEEEEDEGDEQDDGAVEEEGVTEAQPVDSAGEERVADGIAEIQENEHEAEENEHQGEDEDEEEDEDEDEDEDKEEAEDEEEGILQDNPISEPQAVESALEEQSEAVEEIQERENEAEDVKHVEDEDEGEEEDEGEDEDEDEDEEEDDEEDEPVVRDADSTDSPASEDSVDQQPVANLQVQESENDADSAKDDENQLADENEDKPSKRRSSSKRRRRPEAPLSWAAGRDAWEEARNDLGDRDLWDRPNACDPQVLSSSAPLSVLYGLTKIWDRVSKKREGAGRSGQPLEVHVLGAAYPFEGRSNWTLLANRRPPGVPRIRVSLILGTPFQSDNVPPIEGKPVAFTELFGTVAVTPKPGKWDPDQEEVVCKGNGRWGMANVDTNWKRSDLCRDHGNGLEVVCVEKFYQDVRTELTPPDMAVMFSPGFPQLGRRSWDPVLIGLLNDKVPLMLSDVISLPRWGNSLSVPQMSHKPVLPGGPWNPSKNIGEDWQTWLAMKKFGAQKVVARRGPFPILHFEDDGTLAKNAVIQIYEGYKPNRRPTAPLSEADITKYNERFKMVDWSSVGSKHCSSREMKSIFKTPTSRPFDNAVREMYFRDFRSQAHKRQHKLNEKQRARLETYGLLGNDAPKQKRKRWDLKAWVFLLKTLGCSSY